MTIARRRPYELSREAAGDGDRYLELLGKHGHLVEVHEPCAECGREFLHYHDGLGEGIVILDVFGQPLR